MRAMLYVWEDTDTTKYLENGDIDLLTYELKFGDHISEADTLDEAIEETKKYIRTSLSRQKHKYDENRILIHNIWDATEYAKIKNRFGKHQKLDDVIRPIIGYHVQADIHRGISSDDLIIAVNKELIKHNQKMKSVGLAQWQFDSALNVLNALAKGSITIVAELCARFGKTIWAGALIRETNTQLTVIASYVLTVFTSFVKDFTSFEQFTGLVLVDMKDDNYKEKISSALESNKQVVALLSMCSGGKRQEKIDFLYNQNVSKMTFVDEADFGVHKLSQSQSLIEKRGDSPVILMTGTNGDRASSIWPVDHYLSVTYPELLIEKHLTK